MSVPEQRVVVVPPGEGRRVGNVEFLARSRDTPRFNLALITIQAHSAGPGLHAHADEDDSFYILEGQRLAAPEVAACLRDSGFPRVTWRRTLMYYPHVPAGWFRWFDTVPSFGLFRAGFWSVNLLVGRWGNKLALAATRDGR